LLASLGTSIANVGLPTPTHVSNASFQQVQRIVLAPAWAPIDITTARPATAAASGLGADAGGARPRQLGFLEAVHSHVPLQRNDGAFDRLQQTEGENEGGRQPQH